MPVTDEVLADQPDVNRGGTGGEIGSMGFADGDGGPGIGREIGGDEASNPKVEGEGDGVGMGGRARDRGPDSQVLEEGPALGGDVKRALFCAGFDLLEMVIQLTGQYGAPVEAVLVVVGGNDAHTGATGMTAKTMAWVEVAAGSTEGEQVDEDTLVGEEDLAELFEAPYGREATQAAEGTPSKGCWDENQVA
jgi:hypothetical protein